MNQEYWLYTAYMQNPDTIAIYYEDKQISYREYFEIVWAYTHYLDGLKDNHTIGLFLENRLEYLYLVHACALSPKICVTINTRLNPNELRYIIEDSEVDLVITSDKYSESIEFDKIIVSDIELQTESLPIEVPIINLDSTFLRVYTSGTTGRPKGANITFKNVYANAISSKARLGSISEDNWLLNLPLFHVGGISIIFRSCVYRTSLTLLDKFDENSLGNIITKYKVTMISVVPTMIRRMMQRQDLIPILKQLRVILVGGDRTPESLVIDLLKLNLNIFVTYGMTETFSQIATATPLDLRSIPACVGHPLDGLVLNIVNDANELLGKGEHGEVCVKGDQVISCYHPNDFTKWDQYGFHTGDMGLIDTQGYLHIQQRRTDLIISGGENIYPSEVEEVIRHVQGVNDVIVIGEPDPEWENIPVAVIETKTEILPEVVIEYCSTKLAKFKIPKRIIFTDSLPRTPSGKIIRQHVRYLLD